MNSQKSSVLEAFAEAVNHVQTELGSPDKITAHQVGVITRSREPNRRPSGALIKNIKAIALVLICINEGYADDQFVLVQFQAAPDRQSGEISQQEGLAKSISTEVLEEIDVVPEPWSKTDHSRAQPIWDKIDTPDWIFKLIKDNYEQEVGEIEACEELKDNHSSDIYAISGSKNKIVLKFFRTIDDAQYITALQTQLASEGVFGDYGKFIEPISPYNKGRKADGNLAIATKSEEERHCVANHFIAASAATRYKGLSLEEIETAAELLGSVNNVLSGLEKTIYSINPYRRGKYLNFEMIGDNGLLLLPKPTRYFLRNARTGIENAYQEVQEILRPSGQAEFSHSISLDDVHPHNAFVHENRCVLYIDPQPTREWPEMATFGFALHRMCRNYVTNSLVHISDHESEKSRIAKVTYRAVARFIRGYNTSRPGIINNNTKNEIMTGAKAINIQKIFEKIHFILNGDPRSLRTQKELHFSLLKFLGYMPELDVFQEVLGEVDISKL